MAEELINQIISNDAFKQMETLRTELKGATQDFLDAVKGAKAFDAVLRGAKGLRDLEKAIREGANAQELLAQAGQKVIETTTKVRTAQKAAADSLYAYNERVKQLTNEYNALGSSEEKDVKRKQAIRSEVLQLNAAFSDQKKALQDAKKGIDAADNSYYELQQVTRTLERQLKNMPGAFDKTTGAINKNNKEAVAMARQIKNNNDLLKGYDAALGQHFRNVGNYGAAANGLKSYFTYLTGFAGAAFVAASATRAIVNSNIEISDSLTEVQRVGKLTTDQTNELYDALKQIDTRTSLSGLLDLARIGAQMGIATQDLAGFTKAMNELTVTLGGELKGDTEEIATNLGKVNNLLDITQKYGTEEGLRKTGSAILAVGQAGIATGEFLAQFAERAGGIAKVAKLSLPDLLAYGATLEANGVKAELAGTTFTRLITQMGTMPKAFFAVAKAADPKITLEKFTDYINQDANKALQLFLTGVNNGGNRLTEFAQITKSLKLPGQRASQVIAALATNLEDIAKNTRVANNAFNDGTIILDQYALKNDNLAGAVDKLKNEITKIVTDPQSDLGNYFKSIIVFITDVIRMFNNFGETVRTVRGLIVDMNNDLREKVSIPFVYAGGLLRTGNTAGATAAVEAYKKRFADALAAQKDYEKKSVDSNKKADEQFEKSDFARRSAIAGQQRAVEEARAKFQQSANLDKAVYGLSPDGLAPAGQSEKTIQLYNDMIKQEQVLLDLKKKAAEFNHQTTANAPGGSVHTGPSAEELRHRASELRTEASQQIALDKAVRESQVENARKEADAARKAEEERLQNSIDINEEIAQDDQRTLDDRIDAFKKYTDGEIQLINMQRDNEVASLKDQAFAEALALKQRQALLDARKKKGGSLTSNEASIVTNETVLSDDDKKAVTALLTNQIVAINQEAANKAAELLRNQPKLASNILLSNFQGQTDFSNSQIDHQFNIQQDSINKLYENRQITEEKFNELTEKNTFEANKAKLENSIATQKAILSNEKISVDARLDAIKKLNDLERELSDDTRDHIINNENTKAQHLQDVLNKTQQYGDQLIDIAAGASNVNATAEKNAIQDQIDRINDKKQAEIDAVEASTLSQQEKADKIAVINARASAQTEQLARRQRQISEQQARFDKAKAIFDILVSTPQAVMQALKSAPPPFSFILAATTAAFGAAQLAIAAATPLPQYFKGREDGPAEWALVSEQGPELMELPDGRKLLTPEQPTVMFLPEHAKVTPHNETLIEMAKHQALKNSLRVPHPSEVNSGYIKELTRQMDRVEKAIKQIPIQHTHFEWSESGVKKWMEKGAAQTTWLNNIKS